MPILSQTHITLLVDRTGSMLPYADQVVDGLNYYVKAVCAKTPGPVFATLTTFAEEVTTHYAQRPIHQVDKLRLETYCPEGQTVLYDAITTVLQTIPVVSLQQQLLIVLSDGEDVCSYTSLSACADQLAAAQQRGVLVLFLGDGPEALATAQVLGIPEHCRYLFTAREGIRQVFEMLTTQTVRALDSVASSGLLPERFFAEQ